MVTVAALSLGGRQALKVPSPHDLAADMAPTTLFIYTVKDDNGFLSDTYHRLNYFSPEFYCGLSASLSELTVDTGFLAVQVIRREESLDFAVIDTHHGQL